MNPSARSLMYQYILVYISTVILVYISTVILVCISIYILIHISIHQHCNFSLPDFTASISHAIFCWSIQTFPIFVIMNNDVSMCLTKAEKSVMKAYNRGIQSTLGFLGFTEGRTSNLGLRRWSLRNLSANDEEDEKTPAEHHLSLFLIFL